MFIGITGSCGKSTTANLAGALLSLRLSGVVSAPDANCGHDLAANIARVTPGHDFCIQELGAWGPGTLDDGLAIVRPTVGVVLNVGRDHHSAFRSLDNTAAEKSKVVACVPPSGVVVLNADDPHVVNMRSLTKATVLTFGRSAEADIRAETIEASWPDRLAFTFRFRGERRRVETRLVSENNLGSVLAALGIVVALEQPLSTAVDALAELEPLPRRMSPVRLRDGVCFVRDDFKAPSDSLGGVLRFLTTARASRKFAVIGTISDYPGRSRPVYNDFAMQAVPIVDELIFVGERANSLWGHGERPWKDMTTEFGTASVRLFPTVREASQAINPELRTGDLVLLKGSGPADHLERILLDRLHVVRCWRTDCRLVVGCEDCDRLVAHGR